MQATDRVSGKLRATSPSRALHIPLAGDFCFLSAGSRSPLPPATLLAGCGKKSGPPPQQSVEVSVVAAKAQSVPITRELVGRLSATRSADVRARVAGVLQKRLYKEGSTVTAGQPMFQIDPAPLRATLAGAEASLAQAQAAATNAAVTAKRNRELAPGGSGFALGAR